MALPLPTHPTTAGAAADAAPQDPLSCITGMSKDVLRNIQRGALSAKARYFLTMLAIDSFGNAGWQKQQHLPNPGTWCRFHLSAWAEEHGWTRQYAWRIREQMVALGILFYEPDPAHPEQGILRWNLDFSQWQALDDRYRRQRAARPGAGRPRKAEGPAKPAAPVVPTAEPADPLRLESGLEPVEESAFTSAKSNVPRVQGKSNVLRAAEKSNGLQKQSNVLQMPCRAEIKRVTPACAPPAQKAARDAALRKELRKKARNRAASDDAADAAGASPAALQVHQKPEEDASPRSAPAAQLSAVQAMDPVSCEPSPLAARSARETQEAVVPAPPARHGKRAKRAPTPAEEALEARITALRAIWLAHPHPRLVKPTYASGWSAFNKGIRLLAEDGVEPARAEALLEAMLTWSRGTYLPTPLKLHHNLDEVQLTLRQRHAQPTQKGTTHATAQAGSLRNDGTDAPRSGADPNLFLIRPAHRAASTSAGASAAAPGAALPGV